MAIKSPLMRALAFWLSFIALLFVSGSSLSLLLHGYAHRIVYGIVGCICALGCTWLWNQRRWESLREYSLLWRKGSAARFLTGLLIGAALMLLILGFLLLFTPLQLKSKLLDLTPAVLFWALSLVPFAYLEEVAFRGQPLVELQKKYGLLMAQCVVALAFAVYHVVYGWPLLAAFAGPFVWSFVFGLSRTYTNGVAMPTGIHVALNTGQVVLGLKPDVASAFTLDVPGSITPAMQSRIDITGLSIQILIGVIGILASYLYQRRSPTGDIKQPRRPPPTGLASTREAAQLPASDSPPVKQVNSAKPATVPDANAASSLLTIQTPDGGGAAARP